MATHTLHAILRAGRSWDRIRLSGLDVLPGGALELARLPGSPEGAAIELDGPYDAAPSGLAAGRCGDVFSADTAEDRIVYVDGTCAERTFAPAAGGRGSAPGRFRSPRGLLLGDDRQTLYVADSGNGRVQVLRVPALEVRAVWSDAMRRPVDLAADRAGRVYVLDAELAGVLRFSPRGRLDRAYRARLSASAFPEMPGFLALDAEDRLFVSDRAMEAVYRFDADGQALDPLPRPETASFQPGALVAFGDRLYIADAASGHVWAFDLTGGTYLGTVGGFRGPVSALAAGEDGSLFIKSGEDASYHRLDAEAAAVSSGSLETERLDAGSSNVWERIAITGSAPAESNLRFQYFSSDGPEPLDADWHPAASLDTLVYPQQGRRSGRYLWVRVVLESFDRRTSPRLEQVRAETTRVSYLSFLPAVYEREDRGDDFLRNVLALCRAELGDLEDDLTAMPGRIEPGLAPEEDLAWLAFWLAFRPPQGLRTERLRAILPRLQHLYRKRGTPAGLVELVELYAGVRIHLFESFRLRRRWQLGGPSILGFDTGLVPVEPGGLVIPDSTGVSGSAGLQDSTGALDASGVSNPTVGAADPEDHAGEAEVWSEPEGLVVGRAVVGQAGPLAAADYGEPLFSETAHHFCVTVAVCAVQTPAQQQAVRDLIAREKPAHTGFHLCLVDARMRVGFQSRLGVDSIVAGSPEPMRFGESSLGVAMILGDPEGEASTSRVGRRAQLGQTMIIQ